MSIKFEAIPIPVPIKEKPTDKDYLRLYVQLNYGAICNEEEIEKITEIVCKAYERKGELL